jgi:membrane protein implicated in regulation of membrane protease activity
MGIWLIWLVLAVVLGIAETLTLTAALGLLGGAALTTAVAAGLGLPVLGQLLVFAGTAVAGLVLVRPVALRHLARSRPDPLVGRPAQVLREVTGRGGMVALDGETWSARALDADLVIGAGATVHVLYSDGATVVVHPREGS